MIPDWKTNCVYFSRLLATRYPAICERLTEILLNQGIPVRWLDNTKDIWARDYCPIQASSRTLIKFRYYPDYLRGSHEHLITDDDTVCEQLGCLGRFIRINVILDGGNVVVSGNKAILTEKIFTDNQDIPPDQILKMLKAFLNFRQCAIIPVEPDDQIGHADGVVRFLRDDLVMISDYSHVDPNYGNRLRKVLARHRIKIVEMPYFVEDRKKDGIDSAVGNYVNFLRVGNLILLPAYGVHQDAKACEVIKRACPEVTVIPVPCIELAREGGVLNCIAWTAKTKSPTALTKRLGRKEMSTE